MGNMAMMNGTFALLFGIIWVGFLVATAYLMYLAIRALRIYIKKNSNPDHSN